MAKTMKQEFEAYGMPVWSMYVVGGLKIVIAICFLAGLRFPGLVLPAAVVLAALMLGAILMHLKIHDAAKKSIPAGALLLISLFVCFVSYLCDTFSSLEKVIPGLFSNAKASCHAGARSGLQEHGFYFEPVFDSWEAG